MSEAMSGARERAAAFCSRYGLRVPILMAPMAGACPVGLAAAVANAGGMGGFGALMTAPDAIAGWANGFRGQSNGAFQINLWVPDPPPLRDPEHERRVREFLASWGPPVPAEAGDARPFDFDAQCEAMIAAAPQVVSSIMGLFPENIVAELKSRGIAWFACATTVAEARAAERAGADAIVAQGFEAGGHRGAFDADMAERQSDRPVRAGAAAGGRALGAGHRRRRHRRRAHRRGGADPRRQRGADRHGAAALPGGRGRAGLGRCAGRSRPRGDDADPRLFRASRALGRDRLRARRRRSRCAGPGALPGAARADGGDARGGGRGPTM